MSDQIQITLNVREASSEVQARARRILIDALTFFQASGRMGGGAESKLATDILAANPAIIPGGTMPLMFDDPTPEIGSITKISSDAGPLYDVRVDRIIPFEEGLRVMYYTVIGETQPCDAKIFEGICRGCGCGTQEVCSSRVRPV